MHKNARHRQLSASGVLVRVKFYRSVSVNYYQYRALIINQLLADAEAGEDGGEDVGGGDGAGDFAEVVEGFAYVLGDEVA